jgi:uncharacterized protein (DUF4415 family)
MTESKPFTASSYERLGSDLAKIDAHVITPEEYEEIPELTEEDFARGQFHVGGKPVHRGRPRDPEAKVPFKIRLRPAVLAKWKETGPGWQTRMSEALEAAAQALPPKAR